MAKIYEKVNCIFDPLVDPLSPMPPTPKRPDEVEEGEEDNDMILPDIEASNSVDDHEMDISTYSARDDSRISDHESHNDTTDANNKKVRVKAPPHDEENNLALVSSKAIPSLSNRLVFETGLHGISIQTIQTHLLEKTMQPTRYSPEQLEINFPGVETLTTMADLNAGMTDHELCEMWKLATGSESPPTIPTEHFAVEEGSSDMSSSNTVFHVARTNCIDLPQEMNSLEISSRDSNRYLSKFLEYLDTKVTQTMCV